MNGEQKPFTFVNMKIEQDLSTYTNDMSSSGSKRSMVDNVVASQTESLPHFLIDQPLNDMDKKEFYRQRILYNYQKKKYSGVLHDLEILEQDEKLSVEFFVLKLKSSIQEQCRLARLSLMKRIADDDDGQIYESFFLNIQADKVNQLMNGELVTKLDSTTKQNK